MQVDSLPWKLVEVTSMESFIEITLLRWKKLTEASMEVDLLPWK